VPALLAPGRDDASFAHLQRRILDMVDRLNAAGVGRGDRVAIVLRNSPVGLIDGAPRHRRAGCRRRRTLPKIRRLVFGRTAGRVDMLVRLC
jgi:acyl-CoA synthetase (AMP-forming)/AMP-acid ligase II